jgi:hypothetical protein
MQDIIEQLEEKRAVDKSALMHNTPKASSLPVSA